jgi:hypothetical protein
LEKLPKYRYCSGLEFYGEKTIPFPSGYMFTITPDIAEYIISNTIIPYNEGIDDRCVGIILQEMKIDIHEFPYICIENSQLYESVHMHYMLNNKECFLIRIRHIKSYETQFYEDTENRMEMDLSLHLLLLKRFYHFEDDIFFKLGITNYLPNAKI